MAGQTGVTGAILAAGFSRRLGRPKQLLQFGGRPLLQYAIDAALAANLDEVILVLGEAAPAILEQVQLGTARFVANDRANEGQSSSIVAAVRAANPNRSGTLIMLGDQPSITADDLNHVLAAFDGSPDSIAMAAWQGILRSPVAFGRSYDQELLELTGDEGARPVVVAHKNRVIPVAFDRPVPVDIDTEEDYQGLLESTPHDG
ncbi:MAG: nucleotidyltransferase family protein [Thermomicrobiales bacterium]|nr:nucleotidyltransferase family protein [Thermomicrobiales bacterium]MCO5221276.1 nucleotidyltransferase family protein [Thermomicrobiales bacterium]